MSMRVSILIFILGLCSCATASESVQIQLVALNDFHGHLEAPSPDEGGAEYIATYIQQLRLQTPNTLVVAAGDLIGASPLLSALFHDEPAIASMNAMGLDVTAVGNHEFDDGWPELLRLQTQAHFPYLAANVIQSKDKSFLFEPYVIREIAGIKIAFVGAVLKGAPDIIRPSSIEGLQFLDEASSINALIPKIKAAGAKSIVVLIHEGGTSSGSFNGCTRFSGAIVDIAKALDDSVDVVVSGHTHQAYNCVIAGKLVTSAGSYGRYLTDIVLQFDKDTQKIVSKNATNMRVSHDVAQDPVQSAIIAKYKTIAAPTLDRVVGNLQSDLRRSANGNGESPLGRVIADAQLEATALTAHAEIALVNPGGIRADLGGGDITYGEVFSVQPFDNNLVTLTLFGDQLHRLLEQQFAGCGQSANRILQISKGFAYSYNKNGAACHKVDPQSMKLNQITIAPEQRYRVTANVFLAEGGDGFSVLSEGTDRIEGPSDAQALEDYIHRHSPLNVDTVVRIGALGRR